MSTVAIIPLLDILKVVILTNKIMLVFCSFSIVAVVLGHLDSLANVVHKLISDSFL